MAFLFSWRQFTTSLSVCWGLHVQNIERRWKMSSRFLLLSDLIKRHVQVLLYWLGGLWEKQNTCQVNYSASVQSNQCTVQHGYNEKAYNEITQPSQFYSPILIMYYKLIRCDKFLFDIQSYSIDVHVMKLKKQRTNLMPACRLNFLV